MLSCLKKFMSCSPPPFSSSFSLPLCLCLPHLVISIGLDYLRGGVGDVGWLILLFCAFLQLVLWSHQTYSMIQSFWEMLRKKSMLEIFFLWWCVFCQRHFFMPPVLTVKLPCFRVKETWIFDFSAECNTVVIFVAVPWTIWNLPVPAQSVDHIQLMCENSTVI